MKILRRFIRKYLRPFWFASDSEYIKPPYVYGFVLMVALFVSVGMFLYMSYVKYPASVLGTMSAVIATLSGLYIGVVRIYDKGRDEKEGRM
jgi:hypothetical protein